MNGVEMVRFKSTAESTTLAKNKVIDVNNLGIVWYCVACFEDD